MSTFLDLFPRIQYDINLGKPREFVTATNIMFRFKIVKDVIDNIATYQPYTIKDGDTPDNLAEKVYGNPEAYWIILYANGMIDPQYDWPLNTDAFSKYIIDKYGSIETAQTTYHHYEKVVTREESLTGEITTNRFIINQTNVASSLSESLSNIPYDTYQNLTATQSVETHNMDGSTVVETVSRNRVTNFDWEFDRNERKREIKVIKAEFYDRIMREYNDLTENRINPFYRTVR